MIYLTFGESIKKKTLELTQVESTLLKYSKRFDTSFEKEILKNEKFINLTKTGVWPVEVGNKGRDNPFITFIEPPVPEPESFDESQDLREESETQ